MLLLYTHNVCVGPHQSIIPSSTPTPTHPQTEMELLVLPLYGALTAEQQIQVFRAVPPHVRKCVVATNIAETSVTVPGVRCVHVSKCGC